MPRRRVVAIVGRPNVGKSTLFNRFLGHRRAVVDDLPGATRDRNYAEVAWNRRVFTLVDTGGYMQNPAAGITQSVGEQVEVAVAEADVILLVMDAKTGPTDDDAAIARLVRLNGTPCLPVVNKVDSERDEPDVAGFYALALGDPIPVSALSGRMSGDLLDEVVALIPETDPDPEEDDGVPRIAVVGRPNVGKSTFVNRLAGEDRVVVSPIPGTTRDAIDLPMKRNGRGFLLVDTAGLRRRTRVTEQVEYYSTVRTRRSLERCDVAIVIADADEGITLQDVKILGDAAELGKGALLAMNKWDLVEKDDKTAIAYSRDIIGRFPSLNDFPIFFVSALSGQRAWKAVEVALEIYEKRRLRIATSPLNRLLEDVNATSPPPTRRGRASKMYYCVQPVVEPPTIIFFTTRPRDVPEHYRRFLERRLRERFDLKGTPVRIVFKKKR